MFPEQSPSNVSKPLLAVALCVFILSAEFRFPELTPRDNRRLAFFFSSTSISCFVSCSLKVIICVLGFGGGIGDVDILVFIGLDEEASECLLPLGFPHERRLESWQAVSEALGSTYSSAELKGEPHLSAYPLTHDQWLCA